MNTSENSIRRIYAGTQCFQGKGIWQTTVSWACVCVCVWGGGQINIMNFFGETMREIFKGKREKELKE
jgi:hypothetical protein